MKKVVFPTSRGRALRVYQRKDVPVMKWRKAAKGKPEPTGSRLLKHGLTDEERLMRYSPEGTTPERMVFGWLRLHGFLFTYQEAVLGGRVPGGAVVDFVVYDKYPPIAIRIMSYWHKSAQAQINDAIQQEMLLDLGFYVGDVWENEINTIEKLERKMREILYGTPKFGGGGVWAADRRPVCPICGDPMCVRCSW